MWENLLCNAVKGTLVFSEVRRCEIKSTKQAGLIGLHGFLMVNLWGKCYVTKCNDLSLAKLLYIPWGVLSVRMYFDELFAIRWPGRLPFKMFSCSLKGRSSDLFFWHIQILAVFPKLAEDWIFIWPDFFRGTMHKEHYRMPLTWIQNTLLWKTPFFSNKIIMNQKIYIHNTCFLLKVITSGRLVTRAMISRYLYRRLYQRQISCILDWQRQETIYVWLNPVTVARYRHSVYTTVRDRAGWAPVLAGLSLFNVHCYIYNIHGCWMDWKTILRYLQKHY